MGILAMRTPRRGRTCGCSATTTTPTLVFREIAAPTVTRTASGTPTNEGARMLSTMDTMSRYPAVMVGGRLVICRKWMASGPRRVSPLWSRVDDNYRLFGGWLYLVC